MNSVCILPDTDELIFRRRMTVTTEYETYFVLSWHSITLHFSCPMPSLNLKYLTDIAGKIGPRTDKRRTLCFVFAGVVMSLQAHEFDSA